MEQGEHWQTINNRLSAAHRQWGNNDLWDSFRLQNRVSPMHQAISAIAAVVGEEPTVAASVDFELGDDTYETTRFDAMLWTEDLVVRAVRNGGDESPIVNVQPRAALTGFEIVRAPIVTTSGFESRDDRTELRLTYPDRVVTLKQSGGPELVNLIPSFIRDLSV